LLLVLRTLNVHNVHFRHTLQGEELQSGKEASGTVSEGVPSNGGRATEALREHRSAIRGAQVGRATCTTAADECQDPIDIGKEPPPENPRESSLRKEVGQLKRLLAEKTLEVDTPE